MAPALGNELHRIASSQPLASCACALVHECRSGHSTNVRSWPNLLPSIKLPAKNYPLFAITTCSPSLSDDRQRKCVGGQNRHALFVDKMIYRVKVKGFYVFVVHPILSLNSSTKKNPPQLIHVSFAKSLYLYEFTS